MRLSFFFYSLLVFAFIALKIIGTVADQGAGLALKEHSAENIEGCYRQRKGLALRFVINETFIELKSGDDTRTLAHFRDLQDGMFLFQILDDVFLGKKSSKFPVHFKFIPSNHSNLHDHAWKEIFNYSEHNPGMTNRDSFAANFFSSLDRLKNTTEFALLHSLSTGLKTKVDNHLPLMRFHMLAMTLVPKYGSKSSITPGQRRRWRDKDGQYKEGETKFKHLRRGVTRKKRFLFRGQNDMFCQNLSSDPNNDDCLGMCGNGCNCWYHICGNCCRNQLCFEHDKCCRHNMISVNCLIPIIYTLSCENGYGGYPGCLN